MWKKIDPGNRFFDLYWNKWVFKEKCEPVRPSKKKVNLKYNWNISNETLVVQNWPKINIDIKQWKYIVSSFSIALMFSFFFDIISNRNDTFSSRFSYQPFAWLYCMQNYRYTTLSPRKYSRFHYRSRWNNIKCVSILFGKTGGFILNKDLINLSHPRST